MILNHTYVQYICILYEGAIYMYNIRAIYMYVYYIYEYTFFSFRFLPFPLLEVVNRLAIVPVLFTTFQGVVEINVS